MTDHTAQQALQRGDTNRAYEVYRRLAHIARVTGQIARAERYETLARTVCPASEWRLI